MWTNAFSWDLVFRVPSVPQLTPNLFFLVFFRTLGLNLHLFSANTEVFRGKEAYVCNLLLNSGRHFLSERKNTYLCIDMYVDTYIYTREIESDNTSIVNTKIWGIGVKGTWEFFVFYI